MTTLILTVGYPRSGKSTWARSMRLPIVNRDSIRLALHGKPYLQEAEDMVTVIQDYMVKSLSLAGHDVIILDATHLDMKYINRWYDKGYDVKFKVFDTPKLECIKRATKSDKPYLIPIIEKMDNEARLEVLDFMYNNTNRI